jgi:uncharacterized protein DUF3224
MARARGDFVVTLTPQSTDEITGGSTIARLAIDKQFTGDLIGVSKGEMLSAGTPIKGSAGYVAIERVVGALHGRTGTFVLQHSGTMTRGSPELTVSVVPDSGSGALTGLSGTMRIIIEGKRHSYEFDYTIGIGMNV